MRHHLFSILTLSIFVAAAGCAGRDDADAVSDPEPAIGSSRLAEYLGNPGDMGYPMAVDRRVFRFPDDHGPHPEYRHEWWYVTGNLDGESGARFGFELTLFRFALAPSARNEERAQNDSGWRTNQVYVGHFALTDVAGEKFYAVQRFARGSLGLAGAMASPFSVWLENWSIGESEDCASALWCLFAADGDIALTLTLEPQRKPVLQGDAGLSQKSQRVGNASYYYSMPRLKSRGTLRIGNKSYSVSGLSWLDREWGSNALGADQQGWDWFALQLSDGSDLMFYQLRRLDGSADPHSAGSWSVAGKEPVTLDATNVSIEPLRYWESPLGGRYPVAWRMRIDKPNLELTITPVIDAQELFATVRYWEGAVDVQGESAGVRISGRGYVELTGYARQK